MDAALGLGDHRQFLVGGRHELVGFVDAAAGRQGDRRDVQDVRAAPPPRAKPSIATPRTVTDEALDSGSEPPRAWPVRSISGVPAYPG